MVNVDVLGRFGKPNRPFSVFCLCFSLVVSLLILACRSSPPPSASEKKDVETTWGVFRFDDQLASAATVSAPQAVSSIPMAEPLLWDFKDKTVSWDLVRGRLGFRPDQLV